MKMVNAKIFGKVSYMTDTNQTSEITISKAYLEDMIKTAYRDGWIAHKNACKEISAIPSTAKYVWSKAELAVTVGGKHD